MIRVFAGIENKTNTMYREKTAWKSFSNLSENRQWRKLTFKKENDTVNK